MTFSLNWEVRHNRHLPPTDDDSIKGTYARASTDSLALKFRDTDGKRGHQWPLA
jgi:hypothetical protein